MGLPWSKPPRPNPAEAAAREKARQEEERRKAAEEARKAAEEAQKKAERDEEIKKILKQLEAKATQAARDEVSTFLVTRIRYAGG